MANKDQTDTNRMEKIVSLCKRKGFIFQSAEIYGGLNGCWDYGPLGAEVKRNLKDLWWRKNVWERDDILGLDGSILTHQAVLTASGHVGGFSDPMCDCLLTKARLRADQIEPQSGIAYHFTGASHEESEWSVDRAYSVLLNQPNQDENKARKTAREFYAQFLTDKQIPAKKLILVGESTSEEKEVTHYNPENGSLLTEPRDFELMFKTQMGASADDNDPSATAYLRPETAQSIFVQYKNVMDSNRVKLPFGIAQIGKAFRNEINPRNFTFRSREFEQMEMEYFIHEDADWESAHKEWIQWCWDWLVSIGLPESHLSLFDHEKAKLAFYSRGTTDIMFKYPFGVQELWGIAARGNYDLTQHANASGKSHEIFDEATKKKFVPHVIEPAVGVDRIFLAILCAAYAEEEVTDDKGKTETRTVLRLSPRIAPVKVAVLPLLKNKEELTTRAKALYKKLQRRYAVFYDEAGAIGRRYRRQDEIGTPWCVTIDFDTIEKEGDTFTLRERDSMEQKRITEAELLTMLDEHVY